VTPRASELVTLLFADVATDVELVARELNLHDGMRERLQRALDRLNCAQAVLDAPESSRLDMQDDHMARAEMLGAVELLAERWPRDYPDDAVEGMVFEKVCRPVT
jgi:hypothetical protein